MEEWYENVEILNHSILILPFIVWVTNREVADDITYLELSFLVETTNNVFYSILMYFEHTFPRYPSVN